MITISAAEDAVLNATGGRQVRHRIKVKDSGGTFRDLSTYAGFDACVEASWHDSVDSPGVGADITLKREVEKRSIAPLMTTSPVNSGFAYPLSYSALIDLVREVQIEVAVTPAGIAPVAGDWKLAFHGYVDEVDPASGPNLVLRCSDLQAKLRDTFIERERAYAFAQGANATAGCSYWRPSDTLAVGARGLPTEARKNDHFYRVTSITTGITGTSEPTWPTGGGATVVDGGVTWTESGATSLSAGTSMEGTMQLILNDNGLSAVTLVTPVSPGWSMRAWKQERMSVWDALKRLADQIGWDLRFKWDSGSSSFKLTLSTPDRSKTVADRTFTSAQRYPLQRMATQVQWIRNAVRVVYTDAAALDSAGKPTRKELVRSDATSITAYGRRFCEIAEADASNINSTSEAQTLADAVLADLKSPVCEHECDVPFFRFVELGDLYQWNSDALHYDTAQKLAVTSYTHRITAGDSPVARTTLQCRGKPSTGYERWHTRFNIDAHAFDLDNTSSLVISASDVVGGTRFNVTNTENKNALQQQYELHVDPSAGFSPSNATLKAQGQSTNTVVPDLIPGKTYYAKVVPFGHNRSRIVKGQPSAEFSFVAGRASAGHIIEGIAVGDYPLNGGFETRLDAAGMPDHWTVASGLYGSDVTVKEDGSGISGGRYMRLNPATSGDASIKSAKIPVIHEGSEANRYSGLYRFSAWVKNATSNNAANNMEIYLRGFDYAGVLQTALTSLIVNAATKTNHWQRVEKVVNLDNDVDIRSIDAIVHTPLTSGQFIVDIDEVRCQYLGTPWYAVGDTSKFTDNYESIPGFANSWVNYGGGEQDVEFRRDQFGRVHLRGIMKSGTVTAAAFTLPAGFRPPNNLRWAVPSANAFGQVDVGLSGTVTLQVGSNTWADLSVISFLTY